MYVPTRLSLAAAYSVGSLRTWITNGWEHDGITASGDRVLNRLLDMTAGRAKPRMEASHALFTPITTGRSPRTASGSPGSDVSGAAAPVAAPEQCDVTYHLIPIPLWRW